MSDKIAIRLDELLLRRSVIKCVIGSSREVHIIFRYFFVTTLLYVNIKKQFT